MDGQTIGMCVIGFLLTLAVWLIKDSQRSIVRRIDRYELKNDAEHAKLSEALVQRGKEFHVALAEQSTKNREALAQQSKELTALRVELAKLTVPTEREILEALRQLVAGSDVQERKPTDGDGD